MFIFLWLKNGEVMTDKERLMAFPFKFGFSFAHGPELSAVEISQLTAIRGFCGEIPGRMMDMKKALHLLRKKGFFRFNASEVISTGVTRSIAMQNGNIVGDFKRQLVSMIKESPVTFDCAILDLGLEEAVHDDVICAALFRLLQGMALDMEVIGCKIALPVRIPYWNDGLAEFCLALRNKLMLPQLCFSIDIYPHELAGHDVDPAQLLRWLKFDIGTVRFFYEPETGNHLVAKAIEPWLKFLCTTAFNGQVTFCPRCKSAELMGHELAAVRELVNELAASHLAGKVNAST